MKRIEVYYTYSYDEYGPERRKLPHPKSRLTGRYKFTPDDMYIEVEERSFLGLLKRCRWVHEDSFYLYEIDEVIYECPNGGHVYE